MEKGLSRKGKRLLLPIFALVGLLGIGAMCSPTYEEVAATDSSTSQTTYTIYRHKITRNYYNSTISKMTFSGTEVFNLGGKKWNVTVVSSSSVTTGWQHHYENSQKYDSYGRGLRFGTSSNPVNTVTFTLPASELGEGTVVQSLMVNSAADATNTVDLTMKVGDTTFGSTSKIEYYDHEWTVSTNATSGDVTFTWDQTNASKKVPIYVWYFEVRYATTDNNYALHYADTFMAETAKVCLEDGDTIQDSLKSTWADLATQFKALSETDQSTVSHASSETDTSALGHMAERYDYIYKKYGTSLSLENFLNRAVVSNAARILYGDNGESNVAGPVIAISGVALVSIALVSKRIVRKKRG